MLAPPLPIARTPGALRVQVGAWRAAGERVGLVPTMGALHEGHLSLVRLARAKADRVVVSIFVNPTQFAVGEDFDAYPRDEATDAAALAQTGCCDLIYVPTPAQMYPDGFATRVRVEGLTDELEGARRPGHFDGVATVVTKLLTQCAPDVAAFGEKDYQQLMVIRRLARDLDLPVEILGAPIARATDGLALSSRNAYLTPSERPTAAALHRVLAAAAGQIRAGESVAGAEAGAIDTLLAAGFAEVDYIQARDAVDLSRLGPGPIQRPARLVAAATLGRVRLLDNLAI
jgi:pantoate--beta-alanine ligase